MKIDKQITICKLGTAFKIFPESKNEIGLWIAHPPCFIVSANEKVENVINEALQYSNSGEKATNDTALLVLRELHLKSWNSLYKTHEIISFSITAERIIITPFIYSRKGAFPETKRKLIYSRREYQNAIKELLIF